MDPYFNINLDFNTPMPSLFVCREACRFCDRVRNGARYRSGSCLFCSSDVIVYLTFPRELFDAFLDFINES